MEPGAIVPAPSRSLPSPSCLLRAPVLPLRSPRHIPRTATRSARFLPIRHVSSPPPLPYEQFNKDFYEEKPSVSDAGDISGGKEDRANQAMGNASFFLWYVRDR
ncbi:hypothetical protein Taro_021876 [Colocasia esculenta]|uniref:Uncharacterized protein n=1 Tax=Colocasia esculenta TaxID=4460 RepID=A0A843V092_COLES|nr:hypothetical protein [Colocasia esculenta]